MTEDSKPKQGKRPRTAKFTQGLLDNDRILEALHVQPGQVILDAGCGTGYMSKIFAHVTTPSGKVYALDIDKNFINTLKNNIQQNKLEVIEGDITKTTSLETASIDLVYISTVIHTFSHHQMQGFIAEAGRLLKPGGRLAIVEIEKKETPFGPPLASRWSVEELKEVVPMPPVNTLPVGKHFYMQIFRKEDKSINY
jgi:ubiquinone/menaquinone biosynthesis C-methylase UbiE